MSGRIPQSFIDELLTRTDIVGIIEQCVPLKKAGVNYKALCPFHNEKSPSFSVNGNKQFYYCFGCGASGNAISFLMDYERLNFVDAIETLATKAGLEVPRDANAITQESDHQALYDMMQKVSQYFQAQLREHEPVKSYLVKRGLTGEIAKQFNVGFAPDGWDNLLKLLGTSTKGRDELSKAGMLVQNESGKQYDRFRNRVMFPIHDRRGRVIAFGGRVLDDSLPKYLNSPETPVFHKSHELFGLYEARQANRQLNQLVVVEGYTDVIALFQYGITYAVATLGTAITSFHLQRLFRTCKQVTFCFDGDTAGTKAAWKALEIALPLLNDNIQAKFLFLPTGEDPDSMIKKDGKDRFEERLANAESLTGFFLDHLSETTNLETIDGRAQLVSSALPYVQKITAPITQELLLDALAKLTRSDIDKLRGWNNNPAMPTTLKQAKTSLFTQTPVRMAIALLLQHPQLASTSNKTIPKADLPGLSLLTALYDLLKENSRLTTGNVIEHWRNKPEFKHLMKLASVELLTPESGLSAELDNALSRIERQCLDHDIEELANKASKITLSNDEKAKLSALLKQRSSE